MCTHFLDGCYNLVWNKVKVSFYHSIDKYSSAYFSPFACSTAGVRTIQTTQGNSYCEGHLLCFHHKQP